MVHIRSKEIYHRKAAEMIEHFLDLGMRSAPNPTDLLIEKAHLPLEDGRSHD